MHLTGYKWLAKFFFHQSQGSINNIGNHIENKGHIFVNAI